MSPSRTKPVAGLLLCASLLAGCAKAADAPTATANSSPAAPPATAATSSTPKKATAEEDHALAQSALLTAADLGPAWSQKAAPTTKPPTSGTTKKPRSIADNCEDLKAGFPVLADLESQPNQQAGDLTNSAAGLQVTEGVYVLPTVQDAEQVIDAFHTPSATECVRGLLGRQAGSDPVTVKSLTAEPWNITDAVTSDGLAAFKVLADFSSKTGDQHVELGFVLTREGRGVALVAVFMEPGAAEQAAAIVGTASKKLADTVT